MCCNYFPSRPCFLNLSPTARVGTAILLVAVLPWPAYSQGIVSSTATPAETAALVESLVQESQKHKVARETNPSDPLWLAEQSAAALAEDTALFNDAMLEIILGYARQAKIKDSAYLADQLPGHGTAQAQAGLALFYAEKNDRERAGGHLKAAMEKVTLAQGQIAEKIRVLCAETLYLLGREKETGPLELRLGELQLLELETWLQKQELRPALTLKQAQSSLDALKERGVDPLRARFLLACAERQLRSGNRAAGLEILPEIGKVAMRDGLPTGHRVLLDLARVAYSSGATNEAEKALSLFLKAVGGYANEVEWKASYLADAADLMLDWKREDQARLWLKEAESGLPKVYVLDVVKPTLAVARSSERLAGPAEGDRLALQAARAGMAHPHPRAQGATSTQVCLFYAEVGRALPMEVRKALHLSAEGDGQ